MCRGLRQQGMTLLEVLVGFVIFSASLVAVLEYVGLQVFHQHRSDIKLQKLELVYEASAFLHAETEQGFVELAKDSGFGFSLGVSTQDSTRGQADTLRLRRYDFSVTGPNNTLDWAVLRIE